MVGQVPGKDVPIWWTTRHQTISECVKEAHLVAGVPAPALDKWHDIVKTWERYTAKIPDTALREAIETAATQTRRTKELQPQHALDAWRNILADREDWVSGKSDEEWSEISRLHELNAHFRDKDYPAFRQYLRSALERGLAVWQIPVPGIWHNVDAKVNDIKAACDRASMQEYYRWLYGVMTEKDEI